MKHRKLGRDKAHRKALLRNLASTLIVHERIETTEEKAKELSSYVEKLVTLAKRGDLHARRQAQKKIFSVVADEVTGQTALQKLFDDIGPRYQDRQGGYTRVIKTEQRRGDGAKLAYIEFV